MSESPFDPAVGAHPRARWRRLIPASLVLVGAVGVAHYFTRDVEEPTMAADHEHGASATGGRATMFTLDTIAARRIGVTYAVAERGPLTRRIRVAGRVVVDETSQSVIAPKVDGWVDELFVNSTGAEVTASTPLFSLYSPMLVAAQEELILAARLAREAAVRGDTIGTATELLHAARRKLEYWDVPAEEIERIASSRAPIRTLVFRAPRSGVVLAKAVVAGQRVMAGEVAFAVADLDRVWIEGAVFEQDLSAARVGGSVAVEATGYPGRTRSGRVTFVSPVVNEETRTIAVRVEVENADRRFKPGMLVSLDLATGSAGPVVHVPRSAVLVSGTRAVVFTLMSDGMLEPREVRIGLSTDDRVEVVSGLAAGETVVRSATFLVDAESNLRSALGGMAAMPGMDMAAAVKVPDTEHEH
jgi:Cu(I)/Ag(I) efflux system membrane fusion protein